MNCADISIFLEDLQSPVQRLNSFRYTSLHSSLQDKIIICQHIWQIWSMHQLRKYTMCTVILTKILGHIGHQAISCESEVAAEINKLLVSETERQFQILNKTLLATQVASALLIFMIYCSKYICFFICYL